MRKIAVAGVSALSIAAGSVAVAAALPTGVALAQDSGPTTTAPPATPAPGAPSAPKARAGGLAGVLSGLVADGTITQDQADKIQAKLADVAKHAPGRLGGAGFAPGRLGATVEEIATYLGTDVAGLREQLKTKSLGEIAGDKKAGLVQLLTDQANARIDEAVTKGKLTAEQATKLKAATATRLAALVDHVGGAGGTGGRGPFGGRPGRGR